MIAIISKYVTYLFIIINIIVVYCNNDIKQIQHCKNDGKQNAAVIVGTLDGKLSALNADGSMIWNVDTGPGPLLISNIHKLELNNNGQLIRIIPSLTGSLYKFDGQNIDSIPINADNLLKSSFLYSDDLVLAGGRELRTYGIGFKTGNLLYECSLSGCKNKTDYETESEDILVIERTTITVRAHEPRSGTERWNFSVGLHNIKLPQISCIDINSIIDLDFTAIVPQGILIASINNEEIWKYKFNSPIVTVWKWNGEEMKPVDLFAQKTSLITTDVAALYLGMHNNQLYIHESELMLNAIALNNQGTSTPTIPWKPVNAAGITGVSAENNQHTGISVLQSSEYVNGKGFYLYLNNDFLCKNATEGDENMDISDYTFYTLFPIMVQVALLLLITIFIWQYNFKKHTTDLTTTSAIDSPKSTIPVRSKTNSESSDVVPFSSRFANDFETVKCLGKGGFGIVFEVRRNLDECCYAIKRITLPKDHTSKEKVMREVRILAKLEHQNIVRYYNSWVENPPICWCKEHDDKYIKNMTDTHSIPTTISTTTTSHKVHKRNPSIVIDIDKESLSDDHFDSREMLIASDDESHGIYFENSGSKSSSESINKNKTESSTADSVISTKERREIANPLFLYIQMQLCQEKSLKEWLTENYQRDYRNILNIFSQILDAVEYIHKNGLIHRDLKPSNIFFSLEGNIKVGDFGLVTGMIDNIENEKHIPSTSVYLSHTKGVGTQLYMSPEQRDGKKYNYKVDIWSLGILFFELLYPFSTEMERTKTLSDLHSSIYPETFLDKYAIESDVLRGMLCHEPDKRPNTSIIKSQPIFYSNYNKI